MSTQLYFDSFEWLTWLILPTCGWWLLVLRSLCQRQRSQKIYLVFCVAQYWHPCDLGIYRIWGKITHLAPPPWNNLKSENVHWLVLSWKYFWGFSTSMQWKQWDLMSHPKWMQFCSLNIPGRRDDWTLLPQTRRWQIFFKIYEDVLNF